MAEENTATKKRNSRRKKPTESVTLEDFSPTERALITIVADKKGYSPKEAMVEGVRFFLQETVKIEVSKNSAKL